MSDVSGIPYMGTMGTGNFFAPQFSYNPQIDPTAGYAGPSAYGQAVLGGILQNTQRSQQHTADLITSAAMAMPNSRGGAYMFSDTGGPAGGWGGNAFNQGAINNFVTGGGGYNFPSIPDTSGGLGGGGGGAPAINWNTIFQSSGGGLGGSPGLGLSDVQTWAGNWNTPQAGGGGARADPYPNMSMPGGLNSPMSTPQQPATTDPYPNMSMPGGLNSPMSTPQPQQPPIDYGSLFGQGVGGIGGAPQSAPYQQQPYTSGIAPDETGGQTLPQQQQQGTEPAPLPETSRMSDALLGYTPREWPESAYDKPSDPAMDRPLPGNPYTDPQGGGLSAADVGEQARAKLAELMNGERKLEMGVDPQDKAAPEAPAVPAEAPAEAPATPPYPIPLPRERPAGADAPRPPGDIPPQNLTYLQGKGPKDLIGVNKQFAKALQEFTREYNASQGDYSIALRSGLRPEPGQRLHRTGEAIDINLIDRKTGERLNDYQTRDPIVFKAYQDNANQFHSFLEKNYPELAAMHRWGGYFSGGPGQYGASDLMHHDLGMRIGMAGGSWKGGLSQQSADAYGLPTGGGSNTPWPQFNFDWSNAPIKDAPPIQQTYKSPSGTSLYQIAPDGTHIPVPIGKGMNETTEYDPFRGTTLPTARSAATTVEERPGVNQGQAVPSPPADIPDPRVSGGGFNALDAAANAPPAPVKHTGLELARANIDTPIEKIAMERGGQKAVDQVSSMAVGMTPRQLMQSYGGMFMSRAEPMFKSLGITRQDFEKAITMPPTRQDLKMRFAGGDFEPYAAGKAPDTGAAPDGTGTVAPSYWKVPQQGTPEWNKEVYEPFGSSMVMRRPAEEKIGGSSQYDAFPRTGNVEDRRNEQLPREELARLKAQGYNYTLGPEADMRSNPLSSALGLGDLPVARGGTATTGMRPQSFTDLGTVEGDIFGEPFSGDAGMRDFQSPANDYSSFQQQPFIDPWQASIPAGRNSPEVVDAVKAMAARLRTEPATVAATIQQETHDNPSALWNPQIPPNKYGFRGLTQMGRDTFTDAAKAGMPIGSFPAIEDYQRGTAEQQIGAYGDWLDLYTLQNPQGAAAFINSGGLEGLPPDVAAAFMQGTQFAPNASKWARAFEQGNRDMPTTRTDQAEELRPFTINSMTDVARRHMAAWPQQQLWSDYNMPRRPGGY